MTFQPDKSQEWALLSWYKEGNPLYKNPRHPVIGLAGEAGELLNLYKKFEYKPGYDFDKDKFIEELSDYSYYLRILCWQKEVSFEAICNQFDWSEFTGLDLLECLSLLSVYSSGILQGYLEETVPLNYLHTCIYYFQAILSKLDVTLEQVLDLNYKKLNSDALQHGWASAR